MVKVVSWNINSIRIRLELIKDLVQNQNPDIICLQEVKAKKEDFPFEEIKSMGFEHIALYSMPAYNGVAILAKKPFGKITQHNWCNKNDARHISVITHDNIEIHNIYIPAGGDVPDITTNPSFAHKLNFVDEVGAYFAQNKTLFEKTNLLICGDFNIAPLENDVWGHKQMLKTISHTPIEVEKLTNLYNSIGFVDVVRKIFPEPQKLYSWWSYRNPKWQENNKGRRLDHIWCNKKMASFVSNAQILQEFRSKERPSDHVPIAIDYNLSL